MVWIAIGILLCIIIIGFLKVYSDFDFLYNSRLFFMSAENEELREKLKALESYLNVKIISNNNKYLVIKNNKCKK